MAQDAPKRRFLSLIFLVSCISKSFLIIIVIIIIIILISLDLVIKLIRKTNATRFILATFQHRPMSSSGNEF